ncbi:MAG: hypothetical protein E7347_01585 [Clostridiales bacterium]|nr:hypothetical protein [Clostridiales bacterium]
MKIEMHYHPHGGSNCANGDNLLAVKKYAELGYKAIVATTHYDMNYYMTYPGASHKEKLDYFFKVYDDFEKVAKSFGLKTFLGSEIRCLPTRTEYMLLGFDRQFLYDNVPLFLYAQQDLFALAKENGFLMYQTHPFRTGVTAGLPEFMHGAESFNGHYHHQNNNDLAREFCKSNGLLCLSGTDYHHDDQPITAGINVPDDIENEKQLVKCIFDKNYTLVECEEEYLNAFNAHLQAKKK